MAVWILFRRWERLHAQHLPDAGCCNPWIPWMESSTPVHLPRVPRVWFLFWAQQQQQRGRRISVPQPGMLGASTFLMKAGFNLKHRSFIALCGCRAGTIPDVLCDNSRCARPLSWLGWSCRRSSGKLRSSSVKSQALLPLRSRLWRTFPTTAWICQGK